VCPESQAARLPLTVPQGTTAWAAPKAFGAGNPSFLDPSLDDLAQNVEQKLMRFLNPRS
jgi:hypothetical protein